MQIKAVAVNVAALLAMFFATGSHASSHPEPNAPRISCAISMQYWCIVQSPAIVNMVDDAGYRTWTIASKGARLPGVVVRESRTCDSPAESQARKIGESDVIGAHNQRYRVVKFSFDADDSCTVQVKYALGHDGWAREAERMAKYGLLLCNGRSCRVGLLSIPWPFRTDHDD